MSFLLQPFRLLLLIAINLIVVAGLGLVGAYIYLAPSLPAVESMHNVELQVPLRVYSQSGELLAEYGEKRSRPLPIAQVPDLFVKAFLAAEDDRFFEHPGVDYQGILRAAVKLAQTGEKSQGGSTITMQLARNVFLSSERTYIRKLKEIILALKIERSMTKQEILELYLNRIYLGQRSYGIAAAAETYYGIPVQDLRVDQMALIAGLPKAPSRYNPVVNPQRAQIRRDYVLGRMHELQFISDAAYRKALSAPMDASMHSATYVVDAPDIGEMVRADMVERFGEDAYNRGFKVYTTINASYQHLAEKSLRNALIAYDHRHGYRGAETHVKQPSMAGSAADELLDEYPDVGGLKAGLVVGVSGSKATVYIGTGHRITLDANDMAWASTGRGMPVRPGDIIRLSEKPGSGWQLAQIPEVAGALVAINPRDGRILALVGGFDFGQSKFNRAIQAQRQPGSAFKPFVYSAALEKGFTPATLVNDAPIVLNDVSLEGAWRPENYSREFYGPTRLREALVQSRNLVSIRVLNTIGIDYALGYLGNFGFDAKQLPHNLSLALGSGVVTPLQLTAGYCVFANGGYRVRPFLIDRIETADGKTIFKARSGVGERAIPAANAYQMTSMMADVVRRGTAAKVAELGRSDLAGKTGTTNDQRDAWFAGFNGDIAASAWVGFDKQKPLGAKEVGAIAALPMWMDFMGGALKGRAPASMPEPSGLIRVRIDPDTGRRASAEDSRAMFELFREGQSPEEKAYSKLDTAPQPDGKPIDIPEQMF